MAKASGGSGRGGALGRVTRGAIITDGHAVTLEVTRADRANYYGTVLTARPGTFAYGMEFAVPRSRARTQMRRATEREIRIARQMAGGR